MSTTTTTQAEFSIDPADARHLISKRSYATLSTVSAKGRPHAAGVLYGYADGYLFVSTDRPSRKALNVAANPHVAVSIPIRRMPVGPPSQIHFQGIAELIDCDDPQLRELASQGKLKAVTSHGELERPGGCFVRISPAQRVHTYGLGMSLISLIRNPLDAAGSTSLAG